MTKVIDQRKKDHLRIALSPTITSQKTAGFEKWQFIHNALPEINFSDVSTETSFLGKTISAPFIISCMTGGETMGKNLNIELAKAAHHLNIPLGLGSIRPALEDASKIATYAIARETAPHIPIMANIGLAQLIQGQSIEKVSTLCTQIGADALAVHLNPLQEVFQTDGDTQFAGGERVLQQWIREFPLPIIVKEVGMGLSLNLLYRLESMGLKMADIAGAGGTNWVLVEEQRLPENDIKKEVASSFSNWGETSSYILENYKGSLSLVASGGINDAMSAAVALALGAKHVASARSILLSSDKSGAKAIIQKLETWQLTLKTSMFATGQSSLKSFIGNTALLRKN